MSRIASHQRASTSFFQTVTEEVLMLLRARASLIARMVSLLGIRTGNGSPRQSFTCL
jgi:hypothetical protein